MARPSKHDGAVFKCSDGKILWITYRDRDGKRVRESTFTEDWQEAQRKLLGRVKFPSKPYIPFRAFSVVPTTWGICSSLDGQPQRVFQMGF